MTDNLLPLVDDWPFPLFKLDDSDQVLWANQAAQEWLNKSLRKLIQKTVWDLFETEPVTREMTQKTRDKKATTTSRHCLLYTSPSPRD